MNYFPAYNNKGVTHLLHSIDDSKTSVVQVLKEIQSPEISFNTSSMMMTMVECIYYILHLLSKWKWKYRINEVNEVPVLMLLLY